MFRLNVMTESTAVLVYDTLNQKVASLISVLYAEQIQPMLLVLYFTQKNGLTENIPVTNCCSKHEGI